MGHFISRERSSGTVESYLRTVRAFHIWLDGSQVREDSAAQWKGNLFPFTCSILEARRFHNKIEEGYQGERGCLLSGMES